jgi:hypothetical protein
MSGDLVKQSIAELQDLVRCRCHPAYTGRGLHDPDCECDSADAVQVVVDRIKELEVALRGLMEYANDPVIPSEHGIADAPTTEQWRHFYRNYAQWAAKLSRREIAARSVLAELKGEDRG